MRRHGKDAVNTAQDNKAFEKDEKKVDIKRTEFDLADIDIKFKKNGLDGDGDLANYEQPIYMNREGSCISISQSGAPDLLIEFDTLHFNSKSNTSCWVQRSRWLIYEEDYDIELKRYSAPHLSTLSIKGLNLFKNIFKNGNLSFKDAIQSYADILTIYSNSVDKSGQFSEEEAENIRKALVLNHYHAGMNLSLIASEVPTFRYNEKTKIFEENENSLPSMVRKRSMPTATFSEVQSHKKLSECLNLGTEGFLVQVGTLEIVKQIHSLFIRLEQPIIEYGLLETQCPLRFVFIIFGPKSQEDELMEVGRVFSIMMSNRVFRDAVYHAESKKDIINATKKFLECSVLIHLNKRISTETLAHCLPQLKQYANRISAEQQRYLENKVIDDKSYKKDDGSHMDYKDEASLGVTSSQLTIHKKGSKISRTMKQFIPPFRQVYYDLKGMPSRYWSDYKDAFTKENAPLVFSGFVFVYFVVLSPAITFGALFNSLVTPKMTITLVMVASGAFQLLYSLFSGQPLEIVGVTPTVFVVEQVLAALTTSMSLQLEVMRFWIGVYLSILGFIFTMFNGAVIIQHFRRSVEEVYNTYFSTIFILAALFTMFKGLPYTATPLNVTSGNITVYYNERIKFGIGGSTLFLALVMLNACLYLVKVNRGIYLRRSIRKILGAFNVPIGIIIIVALNLIFFPAYQLPTLNIPPSNVINISLWVNFPQMDQVITATPAVHGYSICIAISMFFMLMVEVSTNAISAAKSERKLKKKNLYSLNYLLIICIFPLISIFLGWPFVSGAMVRSNAHCLAMAKWSANNVPGVPKKVIGECEQRVSGILVSVLVILSVFLGSALRYIPMASMYGMFLYMGVMGISDMILWKRLVNLLQRRKHWNEHDYLKDFPTWNIQILVILQIFFVMILVLLYVLSQFTPYVWTLFLFPLFVGLYAILRGYALPKWPRLNTHLSKMDKKHVVKLYDGKKQVALSDATLANVVATSQDPDHLSATSDTDSEVY